MCIADGSGALMSVPKSVKSAPSIDLGMFLWQIWDTNLTNDSKIGDEFEQNKLSEVCIVEFIAKIHPLS